MPRALTTAHALGETGSIEGAMTRTMILNITEPAAPGSSFPPRTSNRTITGGRREAQDWAAREEYPVGTKFELIDVDGTTIVWRHQRA